MINLDRIYRYRFKGISNELKETVWKEISSFLYNEMNSPERVLDPAAGFCEFINNVPAVERWAVDQNSQFLLKYAHKHVHKISGNCLDAEIPLEYFDVVFVSNFLEHLKDSKEVYKFLRTAYQWLKPSGLLVVMGPNFKYCSKDYFDCSDHKVILTDISLCELGYAADFKIKKSYSKFLPYSFRSRLPTNPILVKSYLKIPFMWSILEKQFLVFFQKNI